MNGCCFSLEGMIVYMDKYDSVLGSGPAEGFEELVRVADELDLPVSGLGSTERFAEADGPRFIAMLEDELNFLKNLNFSFLHEPDFLELYENIFDGGYAGTSYSGEGEYFPGIFPDGEGGGILSDGRESRFAEEFSGEETVFQRIGNMAAGEFYGTSGAGGTDGVMYDVVRRYAGGLSGSEKDVFGRWNDVGEAAKFFEKIGAADTMGLSFERVVGGDFFGDFPDKKAGGNTLAPLYFGDEELPLFEDAMRPFSDAEASELPYGVGLLKKTNAFFMDDYTTATLERDHEFTAAGRAGGNGAFYIDAGRADIIMNNTGGAAERVKDSEGGNEGFESGELMEEDGGGTVSFDMMREFLTDNIRPVLIDILEEELLVEGEGSYTF